MLLSSKYFQYQPIYYKNNEVMYEALLRLPDKKVNIENFIQTYVNKEYFDSSVIADILSDIKDSGKNINVGINVSSLSLVNEDFVNYLISLKDDYKYFHIEVTEHDHVQDLDLMKKNCQLLQSHGLKIALDDYGKGYSNTDVLLSIDFDYVKIDKILIDKIENSFFSYKLLESIVSDISSLTNSSIIIEGIETEKHLLLIKNIERKYRVDFLHQGYFYSKAKSLSQINDKENNFYHYKSLNNISSFYNDVEKKIYSTLCHDEYDNIDDLLQFDPYNTLNINYNQENKNIVTDFIAAFYQTSNISYDIGTFLANAMLNNADCMVVIRDVDGNTVFNNKKHIHFLGIDLVGRSVDSILEIIPDYKECLLSDLELMNSGNIVLSKEENFSRNGQELSFITQRHKIACGDNFFVMTCIYDKNEARIEYVDSLTSCFTRDHLSSKLDSYQYVAFIDLNNFKLINDNYGHEKGDEVLKLTADIIHRFFRYGDVVIRLGGDEFLIFSNIEIRAKFERRLTRVNRELERLTNHLVSIAFGIAPINGNYQDAISDADQQMYQQKYSEKQ
ncbi:GGDEF domain-containing protein [Photobacterium damselae]|uniref:GGDEF domain-containing protein n=1 Tax=Photobacterium damselae TaxID=38293 RepID=UPI0009BFAB31|nr:GGDEF domain-containing protein [Photobacterium damselae]TLS65185.1 GGDEF domain-containing protein [Photobacterium damselae subsp. damselae]